VVSFFRTQRRDPRIHRSDAGQRTNSLPTFALWIGWRRRYFGVLSHRVTIGQSPQQTPVDIALTADVSRTTRRFNAIRKATSLKRFARCRSMDSRREDHLRNADRITLGIVPSCSLAAGPGQHLARLDMGATSLRGTGCQAVLLMADTLVIGRPSRPMCKCGHDAVVDPVPTKVALPLRWTATCKSTAKAPGTRAARPGSTLTTTQITLTLERMEVDCLAATPKACADRGNPARLRRCAKRNRNVFDGSIRMKFTTRSGQQPLNGYTIKRGIGFGGFGEVYFAVTMRKEVGSSGSAQSRHRNARPSNSA